MSAAVTREELIAAATALHDKEGCSCDRKYLMSCPNMANAILRSGPATVLVASPNKPRPDDPLIRAVADTLRRIENNYGREGSGPGSRFEGELLEDVQARAVVAMVRVAGQDPQS